MENLQVREDILAPVPPPNDRILSLASLFFHILLSLSLIYVCASCLRPPFFLRQRRLELSEFLFVCLLAFNITGEKGKKESKKDSKGDDDETASVTSHESSMVRMH